MRDDLYPAAVRLVVVLLHFAGFDDRFRHDDFPQLRLYETP
jgi:hypothetical protein